MIERSPTGCFSVFISVCIFCINEHGLILSVARRGTTDQWGLVGGKVDPEDESFALAAVRELEEETGLKVSPNDISLLFTRECLGETDYVTHTFQLDSKHIPDNFEFKGDAGPVKWATKQDLLNGPFAIYNKSLFERLKL